MPRSYSFDHFQAVKPDVSKRVKGSEREKQTPLKSEQPPPPDAPFNYGHRHAQTEELYKKHRADRVAEPHIIEETQAEAIAPDQEATSTAEQERFDRERLRLMAQHAVSSVLEAAKQAAKGHPLQGARYLADEALSGARRVVKEVSALRAWALQGEGAGKKP
jgi:hypothetical protein